MKHPQPQPGPVVPPPMQFPSGSYPPLALAYQQPVTVPRPGGVTAVAVIGIVLASLWILIGLGGAVSLVVMFTFVTPGMTPPGFGGFRAVMLWNGASGLVSALIAAWLLAVAIGCLGMRPWGRSGIVRYAQVDLVWIAVKLIVALAWAIPAEQQWMNSVINTTAPATAPAPAGMPPAATTGPAAMSAPGGAPVVTTTVTTSGGSVSSTSVAAYTTVGPAFDMSTVLSVRAVATAVVSVIYPVVVLIYMTRPRVKGAFTPVAPPPDDPPRN